MRSTRITPSTEKSSYSLIRGCALFSNRRASGDQYILGTLERVVAITSPFQRSALIHLAAGENPLSRISPELNPEFNPEYITEIEDFLRALHAQGFLNTLKCQLRAPKRYLAQIGDLDRAHNQLRTRCAPELGEIEWAQIENGGNDGGVSTLAARSQFPIELSGRSRVLTLLYSILLMSGVTRVRFADRHLQSTIGDLDIGFGPITDRELGLNYYQELEGRRRTLSLFPIEIGEELDQDLTEPILSLHYGDCDPEVLIDWGQAKRAHLVIHAPIGDEISIGPLVMPGASPCIRCLSLYEIDNWGYTRLERISLTPVDDLPAAVAHYIAAIVAGQVLAFIDSYSSASDGGLLDHTGLGEVSYINFQRLREPQVVAIARHPLCGCDRY